MFGKRADFCKIVDKILKMTIHALGLRHAIQNDPLM